MSNGSLKPIGELLLVASRELPALVRSDAIVQIPSKKKRRTQGPPTDDVEISIARIHTRLYLYGAIAQVLESLPEDVRSEFQRARLLCRVALTYLQLQSSDTTRVLSTLRVVTEDELIDSCDDETKKYIESSATRAALLANSAHECAVLNDIIEAGNLRPIDDVDPRDVVALASARASYDPAQAQPTIHELRKLAAKPGAVGAAANYLLAEIYAQLAFPLEQLHALDEWWLMLAKVYSKHPADLAGSIARQDGPFEQAVVHGARQYVKLLRANGQDEKVSDIAQHFRNAGYGEVVEDSAEVHVRAPMECYIVDPATDRDPARRWVYELLMGASAREGCLIARDGSAPETFPGAIDINDGQFRREVVERLASSGVDVDEGLLPVPLDTRRWMLFRTARPLESVAAGFLPIGKDTSVVLWKAAVFDATTLNGKGTDWFLSLKQAMSGQGDPQTVMAIRDAIRAAIVGRRRSARPKIVK